MFSSTARGGGGSFWDRKSLAGWFAVFEWWKNHPMTAEVNCQHLKDQYYPILLWLRYAWYARSTYPEVLCWWSQRYRLFDVCQPTGGRWRIFSSFVGLGANHCVRLPKGHENWGLVFGAGGNGRICLKLSNDAYLKVGRSWHRIRGIHLSRLVFLFLFLFLPLLFVVCGLWWFVVCRLWFVMVCDGLWWFVMLCDALWWFVMVCDALWFVVVVVIVGVGVGVGVGVVVVCRCRCGCGCGSCSRSCGFSCGFYWAICAWNSANILWAYLVKRSPDVLPPARVLKTSLPRTRDKEEKCCQNKEQDLWHFCWSEVHVLPWILWPRGPSEAEGRSADCTPIMQVA